MKIVAIDQSLNGTGICVFDNAILEEEIFIDNNDKSRKKYETLEDAYLDKIKKLSTINETVKDVLKDFKPDIIVIEGYSFGGKKSLTTQGEVTGIINLLINQYLLVKKVKVLIVPPTQLKKFITGKGSGQKELIIKQVYKQFNYDTDNNNLADSYVLGLMGFNYMIYQKTKICNKKLLQYQKQVIMDLNFVKKIVSKRRKVKEDE